MVAAKAQNITRPSDPLDHPEALMCSDGHRWYTWAQWRQAQVDRIMPPRPKKEWAYGRNK